MEENIEKMIVIAMSDEFSKGKTMKEILTDWLDEEKMKEEGKLSYKDMIGNYGGAIELLNKLLAMKSLKDDKKNRMYIINKIEEYLKVIKDYTEEEL